MPTPDEVSAALAAIEKYDWSTVVLPTEDEIDAIAAADPDNPPFTDEELAEVARLARERDERRAKLPPAAE